MYLFYIVIKNDSVLPFTNIYTQWFCLKKTFVYTWVLELSCFSFRFPLWSFEFPQSIIYCLLVSFVSASVTIIHYLIHYPLADSHFKIEAAQFPMLRSFSLLYNNFLHTIIRSKHRWKNLTDDRVKGLVSYNNVIAQHVCHYATRTLSTTRKLEFRVWFLVYSRADIRFWV